MAKQPYRRVMKAVGQPMERQPFDPYSLSPREVVVEIAGSGVCHTDLGFYYDGVRTNHALPLTLGHEIGGHVIAAGQGAEALLNKAVIAPAVFHCGECDPCQRGNGTLSVNEKMPGVERLCGVDLVKTADALEGLVALQEKRPPRWSNC